MSRIGFWFNIETLIQIVKSFKPDIVYSSTVYYGLLQKYTHVPVVCRSVGNDLMRPWLGYPYNTGKGIFTNYQLEKIVDYCAHNTDYPEWVEALFSNRRFAVMREAALNASLILANSNFTAGVLQHLGVKSAKVAVLVGGVEAKRFRNQNIDRINLRRELNLPQDKFVLLTACRLVAKKGIDLLLQAIDKLRATIPNVHLVIVGDGKYKKKYQELADTLSLTDSITFVGKIPHEEIHQYYWACDLFVLASRTTINSSNGMRDAETMGRVLCEANAAGIPVVASESGGIPSVITHESNGLLFAEYDLEDLAKQVIRIYLKEDLREKLIENGYRRAKDNFDWAVVLQQHLLMFAKLTYKT
jgi:glycosyltransferase involved in cell wall biosynthesis